MATPLELYNENISLVYFTLHKYFPTIWFDEDIQQVAQLGFWIACSTFKPEKGAISGYACRTIYNEVCYHLRKTKPKFFTVSFQEHISPESDTTYEETLEDRVDRFAGVETNVKEIMDKLNPDDKELLQYVYMGYTETDIGKRFHISQVQVSRRLTRISKLFEEEVNNGRG